jgi:predicted regulator of Ras-like GTPase activity (Roadblock/LC7/MglB family)
LNGTNTGAEGHGTGIGDLRWLLSNLVAEVPGVRSVAVVSSDGLLLASSDEGQARPSTPIAFGPAEGSLELSTVVSGLASLTDGAARLMQGGPVKQTVVTMDDGHLFVMAISDGSLLGVHAAAECDLGVVAYQMALFVRRAGHLLTPELRVELRRGLER